MVPYFQAVFERLMMEEPAGHIFVAMETKGRDPSAAAVAGQTNPFRYLYESYIRLKQAAKGRKVIPYTTYYSRLVLLIDFYYLSFYDSPLLSPLINIIPGSISF